MEIIQMIGFVLIILAGAMGDSPDLRYPLAICVIGVIMVLVSGFFEEA